MKKLILAILILLLITPLVYGQAHDRRISDNDGEVLDINSDGSLPTEEIGHSSLNSGTVTLSGGYSTVQSLGSAACKRVTVSNFNDEDVFVGGSDMTQGDVLSQPFYGHLIDDGENISFNVDNISDVYVATVAATGLRVVYTYEN